MVYALAFVLVYIFPHPRRSAKIRGEKEVPK
jgi:hypothetical protein